MGALGKRMRSIPFFVICSLGLFLLGLLGHLW
jgi:hypothetical protein